MKTLKKLIGLACVLPLLSSSALAHSSNPLQGTAYHNDPTAPMSTGSYAFFRAGLAFILQELRIPSIPTDRRRLGAHGSVGYLKTVAQNWAIGAEFGVGYYGNATDVPAVSNGVFLDRTYYGSDAAFIAFYRVTPRLGVRGRIGAAVVVDAITGTGSEQGRYNTNFLYGLGVMYSVTRHVAVAADYTYITGSHTIHAPFLNILQLGFEYQFDL